MNLYELNSEYQRVIELLETCEPEDQLLVMDLLSNIGLERDDKIENTGRYIKNMESSIEMIKAEEKKLAERRKSIESKCGRVRDWLDFNLAGQKYESASVSISYRKSESVEVDVPVEMLPANLVRTKTTHEPDKATIKSLLKNGEVIEGCYLVTKQNMQVK